MTDKEKAIKDLKEALDNLDITNKYRLNIIRAIEYLQKEPVSEDVDEAAKRYAKEEYSRKIPASLPDRCRGCYAPIMYAFEAGAQWDREQMMKDAISGFIFGSRYFRQKNISLTNLSEEQYDKLKDFGERIKVIIIKE